jgi:leader peptidase (prepilin peptidase) / N-methyltransferase
MVFAIAFAIVVGAVAGSFATAVGHRVPQGISIVGPRSVCPTCGATIAAYDNIPILSWCLLRGRARCCGARISIRYPLTELATAALFAGAVAVEWGDPARIAIDCVFATMLAVITLTDLERRIIPNKVLLVGAIICLAIAVPTDPGGVPERLIAAAVGGLAFFIVALAVPRGMGLGDVKLVATMGLFLGKALGPAVLIALLAGSVVGIAIMVRQGAGARKSTIPFGPFLALGGAIAMLCGDALVDLYLG